MYSTSSLLGEQTPFNPSNLDPFSNHSLPNDGVRPIDGKDLLSNGRGTCVNSSLKFTSSLSPYFKKICRDEEDEIRI